MEEQMDTKIKEVTSANLTWVEKYRPGALQELISHEGNVNLSFAFTIDLRRIKSLPHPTPLRVRKIGFLPSDMAEL